jgi:hypothetical protein
MLLYAHISWLSRAQTNLGVCLAYLLPHRLEVQKFRCCQMLTSCTYLFIRRFSARYNKPCNDYKIVITISRKFWSHFALWNCYSFLFKLICLYSVLIEFRKWVWLIICASRWRVVVNKLNENFIVMKDFNLLTSTRIRAVTVWPIASGHAV